MPYYKVTFAPHDTLSYTYEVEVDDPNNAKFVAYDRFRFDIGHDRAKDFGCVDVEEVKEYEDD
jgi:hypothetical protein